MILANISISRQDSSEYYEEYSYEDSSSEIGVSDKNDDEYSSKVFSYKYKVENIDSKLFFNKSESGAADGRVTGSFSVWRPDGKIMTVEYFASKDKGFVPKITISDNIDNAKSEEYDKEYDDEEQLESDEVAE